jgi:hypothetical protein
VTVAVLLSAMRDQVSMVAEGIGIFPIY